MKNQIRFLLSERLLHSAAEKRLLQEWILQNKVGHLMIFTQGSILNRESPEVEENKRPFQLGRELREQSSI